MSKAKLLSVLFIISLALSLLGSTCVHAESTPSVALDGVQIRLTETRGIRYIAEVSGNVDDYDEVGMLIIPTAMLSGELTLETQNAGKITSLNEGFNYFSIGADSFRYTLCLIDVTHEKYDREYVVRPYVKYTENGEQKTLYGTNHEQYIGTPVGFTEKVLALYADNYGVLPADEMETLDEMVTDYYKYLAALPDEPEEDTGTQEPGTAVLATLNEWYWKVGTIAGANGEANETSLTRIYTPGFIPATDDTVITFDGANNVQYVVLEYAADKSYLSTSGWITTQTYSKREENAAYYRCVLTDGKSYTDADIKALAAHLTIKVPETDSYRYLSTNEWVHGTLQSADGAYNSTRSDRIAIEEFLPVDTEITFDSASGNQWLFMEYTEDYLTNTTHKSGTDYWTSGWLTSSSYSKTNANASYVRLAARNSSNSSISDISSVAQSFSVKLSQPVKAYHSFLAAGDIDSAGAYKESSVSAYSHYYIPVNVSFTYDTEKNFTYKLYYYDSSYQFISATDLLSAESSPASPAGAAFYRIVVSPYFNIKADNIDYVGSAFTFVETAVTTWEKGTISASSNGTVVVRDNRIHDPSYYPAENIRIKYTASDDVIQYYVLGYDKDKNYVGTSNEQTAADFAAPASLDGAYYYRIAIATTAANAGDDVGDAAISITYPLFYTKEEEVPVDTTPYIDDEAALEFRFVYNSIYNYSAGNYLSGICMVEDELWLFSTSDRGSDGSGYGVTLRYSMDFENKTATYAGYFTHNFGHTNSINYNPDNKSLTFGNGGADFLITGNYFYVYNNPYEIIKNGASGLELSDAISYSWDDCGIPYMTKLNTAWYGNSSLLVVANNNGYVYKIALGKGNRALEYGNMLEASENEFNGTWDIIKAYEMSDNYDNAQAYGFRGQGYDQCNQGTHFADGTLYLNLGHDGAYIWKCKLYSDGSIEREEFHKYIKDGGAPITSAISGIEKYGDYLIFSNGNYIHVYKHDELK